MIKISNDNINANTKVKKATQEEIEAIMYKYNNGTKNERDETIIFIFNQLEMYIHSIIHERYQTYAKRYYEDMFSAGKTGVLLAIKTYDPKRAKLTTWFSRPIIHEIQLYVDENILESTQHYSVYMRKIRKIIENKIKNNIPYTIDDIVIETSLSRKTVERCMSAMDRSNKVSLSSSEFMTESLVSEMSSPEEAILEKELLEHLDGALNSLNKQERIVITMYNGYGFCDKQSIVTISEKMGLAKADINKIKSTAQRKLKKYLQTSDLFKNNIVKKECNEYSKKISTISKEALTSELDKLATMEFEMDF